MNTMKRLVLGVGRHAATEAAGPGASPGTRFLFSSMEEGLRRHFALVCVPPCFYSTDARRSIRIAIDMLNEVDACVFGLPPDPFDLDAFFLARDRLGKRTPFVYIPLGEFPRGAWFYRNVHRYLRRQDLLLFSSRADRAIHDALVASTPARVAVVPFGIRPEQFRPSARIRVATRKALGVDRDEVVFVYHGRVTAEKNVHGALMMFRRIARTHQKSRMWIVGPVSVESACELEPRPVSRLPVNELTRTFSEVLQGEGLEERVTFWGGMAPEALPPVLGAADVGVNLTLNGDENFGYSTVEAMASGLPVIGTHWGGLKDTIEEGVTGFLVPTMLTQIGIGMDHWCAWRRARALVESVERRRRMGAAARDRVARAFTLDRFSDAVAAELRTQISLSSGGHHTRHVWSPLGRRLAKTYSTPRPGERVRSLPLAVPVSATLFRDHPLMRKVLEPYATRTQSGRLRRGAVFYLATELLELRGVTLCSKDPRYIFTVRLVDAADRAVVRILEEHGFCDRSSLTRHARGRFDSSAVQASLRRLLRAGIVLDSGDTSNE